MLSSASCKNTEFFELKILIKTTKKIVCRGGVFSGNSSTLIAAAILRILIKIDSFFEFSNYSARAELNITKAFERKVNI